MTSSEDRAAFDVVGETTVTGDAGDGYPAPTIGDVKVTRGIAGQFAASVRVTYPGEPERLCTFVGSTYGGPVVGKFGGGPETFITAPERFGNFATDPREWVRRYFA